MELKKFQTPIRFEGHVSHIELNEVEDRAVLTYTLILHLSEMQKLWLLNMKNEKVKYSFITDNELILY